MSRVLLFALVILCTVMAVSVSGMPASLDDELKASMPTAQMIRALRSMSDGDVRELKRRGWFFGGNGVQYTSDNGRHSFSAGGSLANGGTVKAGYTFRFK